LTATGEPRVSVAIATRNRAARLPGLLAALAAQTLPAGDFEVVIVDDSSTDDTAAVLARLSDATSRRVRVITAPVRRGPAAGRNAAWRAAAAPVVAFTDDDCRPSPEWLAAGLAAMAKGAGVVVGRTAPDPAQRELLARPFSRSVDVTSVRFFEGSNVFYRRADLEAVGGFDERYPHPAGEDTDLGLRVVEAGAAPAYAPDALVHHEVRVLGWTGALRDTRRWIDVPRVFGRHPRARRDLLHRTWFWKESHPPALLAVAGIALARRHPLALLLVLPWVRHRTRVAPLCDGPRRRWVLLPMAFTVDLAEVAVMVQGSVRHRTLVL
jgi:GT2 family glycosyltransferase